VLINNGRKEKKTIGVFVLDSLFSKFRKIQIYNLFTTVYAYSVL
jgi:hypothetical protein